MRADELFGSALAALRRLGEADPPLAAVAPQWASRPWAFDRREPGPAGSTPWTTACCRLLTGALLTCAAQLGGGNPGASVVPEPGPDGPREWHELTERCGKCGCTYIRRSSVDRLAAWQWTATDGTRDVYAGRSSTVVDEALEGRDSTRISAAVERFEAGCERADVPIVPDGFRVAGDDRCPSCGARDWVAQLLVALADDGAVEIVAVRGS